VHVIAALALAASLIVAQGISSRGVKPTARAKFSGKPWDAKFTDIAKQAGLTIPTIYGGINKVDYIVETSSGGVAFFDFDNDGWLDIFIVGGTRFGEAPAEATNRLYRNTRDGKFADVTNAAGLRRTGWGSGVTAADYDGDGFTDLFVTYWGENVLYRNRGDGTFEDVTAKVGLSAKERRWGAGATFLDYDRDGDLDLFVSNYIDFDISRVPKPGENANCSWKGMAVACGPRGLPTPRHFLYRNDGGKFLDVSEESGIAAAEGSYGMTAVAADFDDDGWPDIYVACDSTPSLFFLNQRDGTFREEGIERGIALNDDGKEQAGMGVGVGDYNLDGRLDIFKTHFADDTHILYRNEGDGLFRDVTIEAGLAVETRYVGWGAALADFDNDGWPDIFFVTGSVYPEASRELPGYPYESPRMLFRNLGNGRFEQITGIPSVDAMHSSRGMAIGDFDNDGDLDIVIMNRNEPPTLLRNDLDSRNNWLRVSAPIGTRVTALYSGKRHVQEVLSQASFYSSNEPTLHFGLGAAERADLEIRWPDGKTESRKNVPAKQVLTLKR
jgi:hypothetical protein